MNRFLLSLLSLPKHIKLSVGKSVGLVGILTILSVFTFLGFSCSYYLLDTVYVANSVIKNL